MDNTEPRQGGETVPEALIRCEGIDIDYAIEYVGSYTNYINALAAYAEMIEPKASEINSYFSDNDIKAFTIQVHSIKSSSRLLGMQELSSKAEYLERCGKENNIEEIKKQLPEFLSLFTSYTHKLRPVTELKQTRNAEKKSINSSDLVKQINDFKALVEDYDLNGARKWCEEAMSYHHIPEVFEKVDGIYTAIKTLNYDRAIQLSDELIDMLS